MRPLLALVLVGTAMPLPLAGATDGGDCDLGGDVDAFPGHVFAMPWVCESAHVNTEWNADHYDTYRFSVPERARISFTATNDVTGGNGMWPILFFDIVGPDGTRVERNVAPGQTTHTGVVADTPGEWTLITGGFGWGGDTPFHFAGELLPAPPQIFHDDCGQGRDAGNGHDFPPIEIMPPVSCHGNLTVSDDPGGYGNDRSDTYYAPLGFGETLHVEIATLPGLRACIYGGAAGACSTHPMNATEEATISVEARAPFASTLALDLDRLVLANVSYRFDARVLPPVWTTRTQTLDFVLGAPQPLGPLVDKDGRTLGTPLAPEGSLVRWVHLDRPLQVEGNLTLEWDAAEATGFRLDLYIEDYEGNLYYAGGCSSQWNAARLVCPGSTVGSSWRDVDTQVTWVAVEDAGSLGVEATLSQWSWTYADGTVPTNPQW